MSESVRYGFLVFTSFMASFLFVLFLDTGAWGSAWSLRS